MDSSLDALGVDDATRGDIQAMLAEACGNVIRHARDGDDYTVQIQIADERCVIKVVDQGGGFEGGQVPETATVPDLDSERGRGLLIMQALADDVRVHSVPEHGVLVAMEKKLHFGTGTLGRRMSDAAWADGQGA